MPDSLLPPGLCRLRFLVLAAALLGLSSLTAAPVELRFQPPQTEGNPFAREIWARVETPDRQVLELPAFFLGRGQWAVRTRAADKGNYRLLDAVEFADGVSRPLTITPEDRGRVRVRDIDESGGPISIDRRSGLRFVNGFGLLYTPLGGNLPWAPTDQDPLTYYRQAFADFKNVGFNWTRIWMCHWGQLNLDWIAPRHGKQVPLGELSLEVADRLDRIIDSAEANGVRLQLVLQYHGQFTTYNNTNWDENPWNRANGGFLDDPKAFFTDPQARQLTRDKYRYIVARWGYSSAIMAWELFNEVMWTNARRGDAADNASVAAWHTEMARTLRRYDVHGHLVTTSDDDLSHALWSAMDYYQPHLYTANMILALQDLELPAGAVTRPVFYGEIGDDNMSGLSSAQRASGFVQPILAWAGLFGRATAPAQLWYVESIRENQRWPEIESFAAFVRASGILRHPLPDLERPLVVGGDQVPLQVQPGYAWHRGPNPTLTIPVDGTESPELLQYRRMLTSAVKNTPFPSRLTLQIESPAASNATLHLNRTSNLGGALRVTVDGATQIDQSWPAAASNRPAPADLSFPFRLGFGSHTIEIENPNGGDWIDLGALDLGLSVPALTAVALCSPDRIVLWLRHRENLLSPADDTELVPTAATVQLTAVPAGAWSVHWWDPVTGRESRSETITHRGGALHLPTPEVLRHAAAWLVRRESE